MKAFSRKLKRFCAVLIGLVFLASGLLKLLDPVGTGLIVRAYCSFLHLGFLSGGALALGVALSLTEVLVGVALVTGVYRRIVAVLTWILLGVFTAVTLLLVIFNPEMDCGCFGEAIHLTHLQSLLKNLALLLLAAVALIPRKIDARPATRRKVAFWVAAASLCGAAVYCLTHLPALDFTDFAPGSELLAAADAGAEDADVFEVQIFERGGQRGMFSLNRMPDSTWTYVGRDTVSRSTLRLAPSAPVLSFRDADGTYCDAEAAAGKVLLLSVYEPGRMDWAPLPAFLEEAYGLGIRPMLLATEADAVPPAFRDIAYTADYKTLITLNRSNGGATYVDGGMIVRKWHSRHLPEEKDLAYLSGLDPIDGAVGSVSGGRLLAEGFLLYLLAVLLLL